MINGRRIVILCIARLHDMENWRFVDALNKKLFRSGCSLWIYNMTADLYWEAREQSAETGVFDLIDYTWADAVIYMDEKIKSRQIAEKVIENAKAHSVPVVVVDGSYEGCVSVKYDYSGRSSGRMAFRLMRRAWSATGISGQSLQLL